MRGVKGKKKVETEGLGKQSGGREPEWGVGAESGGGAVPCGVRGAGRNKNGSGAEQVGGIKGGSASGRGGPRRVRGAGR